MGPLGSAILMSTQKHEYMLQVSRSTTVKQHTMWACQESRLPIPPIAYIIMNSLQ